jgi:hypothetical protein
MIFFMQLNATKITFLRILNNFNLIIRQFLSPRKSRHAKYTTIQFSSMIYFKQKMF